MPVIYIVEAVSWGCDSWDFGSRESGGSLPASTLRRPQDITLKNQSSWEFHCFGISTDISHKAVKLGYFCGRGWVVWVLMSRTEVGQGLISPSLEVATEFSA